MNEAMINPEIVHWARERAGMAPADLARRKKEKKTPINLLSHPPGLLFHPTLIFYPDR